jgi:hypothetical protein
VSTVSIWSLSPLLSLALQLLALLMLLALLFSLGNANRTSSAAVASAIKSISGEGAADNDSTNDRSVAPSSSAAVNKRAAPKALFTALTSRTAEKLSASSVSRGWSSTDSLLLLLPLACTASAVR